MKEALKIEGRWHIHGEDQPAQYGELVCDPVKGLRLEVKELRSDGVAAILEDSGTRRMIRVMRSLQGFNSHNRPVRLFGCGEDGNNWQTGLRTHGFFALRGVTLCDSGDWHELISRRFDVRFAMLHSWMNRRISVRDDSTRPADIRIRVREGLSIRLGAAIHSKTTRSRFEINHDSWLGIEYSEDQPVREVRDDTTLALALFFTLLIGDPIALDEFKFLQAGATDVGPNILEHRVLERRGYAPNAKSEKDYWLMRATYPEVQECLGNMLNRWLTLFTKPDMRAVLDLYAAVTFSDLYDTAKFLMLAQALEAFHTACGRFSGVTMPQADFKALKQRAKIVLSPNDYATLQERFIFANQKTYKVKLEEVIAAAPAQARMIISDVPEFASVVKDLRNAYTHHVGTSSQRTRQAHDRSIPKLTRQAHALLEMLLLNEMGAPACAFNKIVREHQSAILIDLSDPNT
jgi:hypothetical protein